VRLFGADYPDQYSSRRELFVESNGDGSAGYLAKRLYRDNQSGRIYTDLACSNNRLGQSALLWEV
jgi:hypothetical protein